MLCRQKYYEMLFIKSVSGSYANVLCWKQYYLGQAVLYSGNRGTAKDISEDKFGIVFKHKDGEIAVFTLSGKQLYTDEKVNRITVLKNKYKKSGNKSTYISKNTLSNKKVVHTIDFNTPTTVRISSRPDDDKIKYIELKLSE